MYHKRLADICRWLNGSLFAAVGTARWDSEQADYLGLLTHPRHANLAFRPLFPSQVGIDGGICLQRSQFAVHLVLPRQLLHLLRKCIKGYIDSLTGHRSF